MMKALMTKKNVSWRLVPKAVLCGCMVGSGADRKATFHFLCEIGTSACSATKSLTFDAGTDVATTVLKQRLQNIVCSIILSVGSMQEIVRPIREMIGMKVELHIWAMALIIDRCSQIKKNQEASFKRALVKASTNV